MCSAKAQIHYFTHYQVEQGLSNNSVLCSMQDNMGFMWFGTKDGLNRFDGYSFRVFQNDPNISTSLGSNYVRVLHEAHDGIIWVGTDQGIYLFDRAKEKFELLHPDIVDEILAIKQDNKGDIWFISDLVLFQYQTKKDTLIRRSEGIDVTALSLDDTKGELWMGTASGALVKLNMTTFHSQTYALTNPLLGSDSRIESLLFVDDRQQVIVGTRKQGMLLFDIKSGKSKSLLKKDNKGESIFVRDIIRLEHTQYWFATESGIISYDIANDFHFFITREKENPWSLADNAVYTFSRDAEGAIWIGTYFGGINYYSQSNTFFEKFFPRSISNSISGFAVREIVEDRYGQLWIGTEDGGLNKFDPQTKKFTNFKPGSASRSVAHSNIHGLLPDGDTLWIGTFEHGLDLLDIRNNSVLRHYDSDLTQNALGNDFVFHILKTRNEHILLATSRGLYSYKNGHFAREPYAPRHIFYTSLFEDDQGTLWMGTWRDGLFFYNPETGEKGRVVHDFTNPRSLSSNRVNRIFQDSKHNLWVATEGGLCRVKDRATMEFERFGKNNGFPSNLILSLLEDDDGVLWVSTSKGLVRFVPESGDVRVFTRSSGLLSDQFNYNSSYKDSQGNLYFGSVKGMIRFHPKNYQDTFFEAPVYITGFQIHNQELRIGDPESPLHTSIVFSKEIKLDHNQSTFSIDFAALSYASPTMTEYAYKMEGLDKEWITLKTNRKVYFTNIAPGKYRFRVNVVNSKGEFKGKETYIDIEIAPPIWASTSAYMFYATIILVSAYLLIKNYDSRIKDRNRERLNNIQHEREKKLYKAKIDFFTLIVHEIRTPLTLIKAPLEKLIQLIDATPAIKRNLDLIESNTDRLITLSGQLLDFRKVESHGFKLDFKRVSISALLLETFHGFRVIAARRKIKMTIETPEEPVWAYIDKEAVIKIITNLMDNALKYGETCVNVRLSQKFEGEQSIILISFQSDGPLIPLEMRDKVFEPFYRLKQEVYKQGTGLGLALSRSLAELLNGNLELREKDGMNVFVLTLNQIQTDNG